MRCLFRVTEQAPSGLYLLFEVTGTTRTEAFKKADQLVAQVLGHTQYTLEHAVSNSLGRSDRTSIT